MTEYNRAIVRTMVINLSAMFFIFAGTFLIVKLLIGSSSPCLSSRGAPELTQEYELHVKVVGEVEVAGEKCLMYNIYSEGKSIEDKEQKCMLSYASPPKLMSSKLKCPSGTSKMQLDE